MKKIGLLLFATVCLYQFVAAQPAGRLLWLAGTWQMPARNGMIIEQWFLQADSSYKGSSYSKKANGDSVLLEEAVILKEKDQWYYIPTVQGQNRNQPVRFTLIFLGKDEFICENPAHDFPQRITYRRTGNRLWASIEGRKNGAYRKENFDYTARE